MHKIVAVKDMSAGNESVGEMWQETKIFEPTDTLESVLFWVDINWKGGGLHKRVTITVAQ